MRWRFLDRVTQFEPWAAIAGRKAVSLEEYSLLERFGRKGALPESLLIEICVEAARWLVAASSSFTQVSVLSEIEDFRIEREAGMGDVLELSAAVARRDENETWIECGITAGGNNVARGIIGVVLEPLADSYDCEIIETTWREIHGAT